MAPRLVLGMVFEMILEMISGLIPCVVETPGVAPGRKLWNGIRQALRTIFGEWSSCPRVMLIFVAPFTLVPISSIKNEEHALKCLHEATLGKKSTKKLRTLVAPNTHF